MIKQAAPVNQIGESADGTEAAEKPNLAFEFFMRLAKELKSGRVELPCFPSVVLRLRRAIADPRVTIDHLMEVLNAEPRLMLKIMVCANSTAYCASGRTTQDKRLAVGRIGLNMVQSIAYAFAMQQLKEAPRLRAIAPQINTLWARSVAIAAASQIIAQHASLDTEHAFLAGMLSGVGQLYVWVHAANDAQLRADPTIMDTLTSWHSSIGKAVVENWGFPEDIAEAVGERYNADRILDVRMQGMYSQEYSADMADVLFVGSLVAIALESEGAELATGESTAFSRLGVTPDNLPMLMQLAREKGEALRASIG